MSYTRRLEESAVNLAAEAADLLVQFNYLKAERDEKAKEIERLRAENERMRKEMYEVWKYALGCDCVPSSAYTCRACAIDYPAADVVGELRRARDDSDELWEIVSGVIPDWNEREDEGETKQNRLQSIVAERDALKAEAERLRADLVEAEHCANLAGNLADQLQASRREVEALKAEIERLEFDAMERDELDTMP